MYIIPFKNLKLGRSLVNGNGVSIEIFYIKEKIILRSIKDKKNTFRKLSNHYYSLSIEKLIKDCRFSVGDEFGLY